MDIGRQLAHGQNISNKVALVYRKRIEVAQEHFAQALRDAAGADGRFDDRGTMVNAWSDAFGYTVDAAQRAILFWDTMRERGNQFIERSVQGLPPVLHFDYETVVDGRRLARPVNYALVRIVPPEGVTVDAAKRPYVIIDPRAGHGPGIGGFKDDSQVGVAIREGHPVYFVIFFPEPEPGQTLLDVCRAEQLFVKEVRRMHPDRDRKSVV